MTVSRRHNGLETRSASGVMRSAFFGWVLPLVLSAGLLAPLLAQQPAGPQEVKVRGVILERSADSFTLREYRGTERMVDLGSLTEVKEEKKNFLRPPLAYTPGDLIPRSGRPGGRPHNVRPDSGEDDTFHPGCLAGGPGHHHPCGAD